VQFDPSGAGRNSIARLETASAGALTEIRIFLRGEVRRRGRDHNLDGRETCVAGDGFDVAVMRVRPAGAVPLAGADYRVAVAFDPDAHVAEEHVSCAAGAVTPQFHDPDGPDECRTTEDPGDDGDPTTRLRYVLAGEAVCVAERQGT
jgi:hypothetical protein